MSSDIEIKEDQFSNISIEITTSSIAIWIEGISIEDKKDGTSLVRCVFDLKDSDDRQAIRNLIWHLQHQIETHEKNEE